MSANQIVAFLLVQFFAVSGLVYGMKTHQADQDRRTETIEKEVENLREKR